jgi:hypothetical protein
MPASTRGDAEPPDEDDAGRQQDAPELRPTRASSRRARAPGRRGSRSSAQLPVDERETPGAAAQMRRSPRPRLQGAALGRTRGSGGEAPASRAAPSEPGGEPPPGRGVAGGTRLPRSPSEPCYAPRRSHLRREDRETVRHRVEPRLAEALVSEGCTQTSAARRSVESRGPVALAEETHPILSPAPRASRSSAARSGPYRPASGAASGRPCRFPSGARQQERTPFSCREAPRRRGGAGVEPAVQIGLHARELAARRGRSRRCRRCPRSVISACGRPVREHHVLADPRQARASGRGGRRARRGCSARFRSRQEPPLAGPTDALLRQEPRRRASQERQGSPGERRVDRRTARDRIVALRTCAA